MTAWLAGAVAPLWGQGRCGPVGDARIHTCVYGSGEPTIVLAAGAGQASQSWAPLVHELSEVGTVVLFDRPGLGGSPPVDGIRSPTIIARELHDVLDSVGVSGPIVLVGHSMGGLHVLRYAELDPDSVTGVLLLDVPPPGFEEARMSLLTPREQELRREALAEGRARAPEVVGRERDGATAERWTFEGFPSRLPLIVAVADGQYFGELGSEEAHRELWMSGSEGWLRLSSNSELVVARGSGHMIHHDRPGLVLELIRRLIPDG